MTRDVLPEPRRNGLLGRRQRAEAPETSGPQPEPSPAALPAELDELRNRLAETEARLATEQHERRAVLADRDRLAEERQQVVELAELTQTMLAEAQQQALFTPAEFADLTREVAELRQRARLTRDELVAERAARYQAEQQRDLAVLEVSGAHQLLEAQLEETLDRVEQLEAALTIAFAERDALSEQVAAADTERTKLREELQRARAQASHVMSEATSMVERLAPLEQELNVARHQNRLLNDQVQRLMAEQEEGSLVELRGQLDDARTDLAAACEERDEARQHAARVEREIERLRSERDHLHVRVDEAELSAQNAIALHQALQEATVASSQAAADVPAGMVLVSEAELAAHAEQVRQLDEKRAEEARRRVEADDRVLRMQDELVRAASVQRGVQQRHAELMQRVNAQTRTTLELQKLADLVSQALGLSTDDSARLISQVPEAIARLQSRVGRLQALLEARDAEVRQLRERPLPRAQAGSSGIAEARPVDSAGGERADRLLHLLREAADGLGG